MNDDDIFLTLVVHGESKVGKTWLGSTAPKPALILDAEAGGMRFVPGRKVRWNPLVDEPPAADGTWDICVVSIDDVQKIDVVYQWLRSGQHPFRSVVFDSLTEIQSRLKKAIDSSGQLDQQGWGRILTMLEDLVVKFRDLTEAQEQVKAFVVIAGTRMRDGKFRPFLQGQIANLLAYKLDAEGYLFVSQGEDGHTHRGLQIANSPTFEVGNRLGGALPDTIWEPDITDMLGTITTAINGTN